MSNTLQFASNLQKKLDQAMVQGMLTGWMDKNASQVKYTGGNEVKIATLSTDALGDYNRSSISGAYAEGNIDLKYVTYTMKHDRGRAFMLDAMDVDETGFMATTAAAMNEFQKAHVIPEVDALRMKKCYDAAAAVGHVKTGYVLNPVDIIKEIKTGIKIIRQKGFNGELVCHITYDALFALEENNMSRLMSDTFKINGIDTRVPVIDGVKLIATPENRMFTDISLLDGRTAGQERGGFVAGAGAEQIHFMILATDTPLAITKQDIMRVFDPTVNQSANAYKMDYRRYSDLWVLENKRESLYACTGALPTTVVKSNKSNK